MARIIYNGKGVLSNGSIVITSQEEDVTWTVSFFDCQANLLETQEVVDGEDAVDPGDPSDDGYTFYGWEGPPPYFGDLTNVTEDRNYIADCEENSPT